MGRWKMSRLRDPPAAQLDGLYLANGGYLLRFELDGLYLA